MTTKTNKNDAGRLGVLALALIGFATFMRFTRSSMPPAIRMPLPCANSALEIAGVSDSRRPQSRVAFTLEYLIRGEVGP